VVIMLQFSMKTDRWFRKFIRVSIHSICCHLFPFCSKGPSALITEPLPQFRVILICDLKTPGLCGHGAAIFNENGWMVQEIHESFHSFHLLPFVSILFPKDLLL